MAKTHEVFVIPLDALDLNLLPTSYMSGRDKVVPLWTKPNLNTLSEEYYEFKIKTDELEQNNRAQVKDRKFETSFCHICNIEVPKLFFNVHKISSRHKSNIKIVNIAMHRIISHLNAVNEHSDFETDQSLHFCPTCLTVMDVKSKVEHQKSIVHKNSLAFDKILKDFLDLYEDNQTYGVENNVSNEHETTNLNEIDLHNFMQTFVKNSMKKSENNSKKLLQANKNSSNEQNKDIIENVTLKEKGKDKLSLSDFIALIKECCNKRRMYFKVVDEDVLEIETIDGSTIVVTEAYFHGFNKVGRKHYECVVCKELFKEKQMDKHKLSENHLNRMCLPLEDKNCVRKIADNSNHCVICNKIVEYPDLHVLCDIEHNDRLKNTLVSEKLDDNIGSQNEKTNLLIKDLKFKEREIMHVSLQKDQNTYSEVKSYSEATKISSKEIDEEKHLINTVENNFTDQTPRLGNDKYILNHKDTTTELNRKYTIEENVSETKSEPPTTSQHSHSNVKKEHNIITIGDKNQSMDKLQNCTSKDYKYFCIACNCYISIKQKLKHNNTLKHIVNLKSDFHYLMEQTASGKLICRVCNTQVNNTEDVTEHVFSNGHEKKYKHMLVYNRMNKICNNKFYCELCEEFVWIKNEVLHVNHFKHLLNCDLGDPDQIFSIEKGDDDQINETVFDSNYSDTSENKDNTVRDDNQAVSIKPYEGQDAKKIVNIEPHMPKNENDKITLEPHFCNVCKVKVPNHEHNIKEHEKGKSHINNFAKLCDNNAIKATKINGATNIHYLLEDSQSPGMLSCAVCKLHVMNNANSTSAHLKSTRHLENYKTMLKENYLVKTSNNIYCELCGDVDVGVKNEIAHVKGDTHSFNLERYLVLTWCNPEANHQTNQKKTSNIITKAKEKENSPKLKPEMKIFLEKTSNDKEVMCKICKVKIPCTDINVSLHINGAKHKKVHDSLISEFV